MYDYFLQLQDCFYQAPEGGELLEEIQSNRAVLLRSLSRKERRCLLHILDAGAAYCDKVALENFIAGFKLACGIAQEMSRTGNFSWMDKNERAAAAQFERERESRPPQRR